MQLKSIAGPLRSHRMSCRRTPKTTTAGSITRTGIERPRRRARRKSPTGTGRSSSSGTRRVWRARVCARSEAPQPATWALPDRYNPLRGAAVGPPLEPGTGPVPRRRDHEAGPVRVLPRDRAGARPAPAQPAVHDEALALRSGRGRVLPEAGAEGDALLDSDAYLL